LKLFGAKKKHFLAGNIDVKNNIFGGKKIGAKTIFLAEKIGAKTIFLAGKNWHEKHYFWRERLTQKQHFLAGKK
jgi:hypothetical protein